MNNIITAEDRRRRETLLTQSLAAGVDPTQALDWAARAEAWIVTGDLVAVAPHGAPLLLAHVPREESPAEIPAAAAPAADAGEDGSAKPPDKGKCRPQSARRPGGKAKQDPLAERVVAAIRALGPRATNPQLAEHAGSTAQSVCVTLKELDRRDRIIRTGKFAQRRLQIAGSAPRPCAAPPWETAPDVEAAIANGEVEVTKCPPAYVAPVEGAEPVGPLPDYAQIEAEQQAQKSRDIAAKKGARRAGIVKQLGLQP